MKAIVSVLGKDRVGITAAVCTKLAENNINILDISQTIMDGNFSMVMIVDMDKATCSIKEMSGVPGKGVGDAVEFGGLLGSAPIMPVHPESSEDFIARGGRIPAPIQSLKN